MFHNSSLIRKSISDQKMETRFLKLSIVSSGERFAMLVIFFSHACASLFTPGYNHYIIKTSIYKWKEELQLLQAGQGI